MTAVGDVSVLGRRVLEQFWVTLVPEVREELLRQIEKHGDQSTASPEIDDHTRLVILTEEVGEVARAMTYDEGDRAELRKEIAQVAAVALAWAIGIDLGDKR